MLINREKTLEVLAKRCKEYMILENIKWDHIHKGKVKNPFPIGKSNLEKLFYKKKLSLPLQVKLAKFFGLELEINIKANIKDLDLTDLPFKFKHSEKEILIDFLPMSIKKSIVLWGINDTDVRDQIFSFILSNQFGMTAKSYYDSEIANLYFEKDITKKFDFQKLLYEYLTDERENKRTYTK